MLRQLRLRRLQSLTHWPRWAYEYRPASDGVPSDRKKAEKKAREAAKHRQRARRVAERNRRHNAAPQTPRTTSPKTTAPEPGHARSEGSIRKNAPHPER